MGKSKIVKRRDVRGCQSSWKAKLTIVILVAEE